jgi:hypothetical protein
MKTFIRPSQKAELMFLNSAVAGRIFSLRWNPWAAIALCGLLGFIGPALYGLGTGIPRPKFHDEYSYLLAADTFAGGRLANPPPELPEFFEAEHLLVAPTYVSKYPPGQGLVMAAGQVLFGHPIWGVWLSCGAFAASLCWMLQAWISRKWALVTTLIVIFGTGISSYWAQSYWGGMAAATASALLFGGMRRSLRRPRIAVSMTMGFGIFVLAITRPFEGLVTCLPVGLVMAAWLVSNRRWSLPIKMTRWALPVAVVCLAGGLWIASYNQAVTGHWWQMPYSLYQRQYFHHGMVCGSKVRETERNPCPRLARYYAAKVMPDETAVETAERVRTNLWMTAVKFINCGFTGFRTMRSLSQPRLAPFAALAVVFVASLSSRWMSFSWATICLTLTAEAIVYWWHPHYSAPLFPLLYLLVGQTLRTLGGNSRLGRREWVPLALVGVACGWALATDGRVARDSFRKTAAQCPADATSPHIGTRSDAERRLRQEPGRHLVFVTYDMNYSVHDEWVYNAADMGSARIVFAHDLGDEKNGRLIELNRDRRVWRASVSDAGKRLEPFGSH